MEEHRKWSKASLRIFSEELLPDEVGAVLGLRATSVHVKGEPRSRHHKDVWRDSFWYLASPLGDERVMGDHLNWLLDSLEPRMDAVMKLSETCRIDLFCGFSSENGQGGFTLDPATLARIARLGVPLILDLYPPSIEIDEGGGRQAERD